MLDELNLLTKRQRETYREQPNRMVADYKRERQLIGEYNGRQLLEMLQNADDQGSTSVLVRLNEDESTLTIANQGAPFTAAGIESLMIANLSTKTKARYIGNKGLGFRSILNWADRIKIDSGAVSVTFSEAFARRAFDELFDEGQQHAIRERNSLSGIAVPMAVLALPECIGRTQDGWVTEITLRYRAEYVADIKEQLDAIDATCLLFLNNTDLIIIEYGGQQRRLQRTVAGDTVTVDSDTWTIYCDEELLPDEHQDRTESEPQRYSLKLALTPELDKAAPVLYTYFPTRVPIAFPMVIHGTFDLDSSRNQLIKSERNRYLLGRLVDLIVATASALRERQADPWMQVRLLRAGAANPVLQQLGFYQAIEQRMGALAIFPCVDGQYRRADEVYYLGDAFSAFVLHSGCGTLFPALVYPGEQNALHEKRYRPFVRTAQFIAAVNALSARLPADDLAPRVALIELLCATKAAHGCYSVLVNEELALIDADTDAYTPLTSGLETLAIPSFVNIDFMHRALFTSLATRLAGNAADKARVVERKLKEITNIHSYEPAPVIRSIVRGAAATLARQDAAAEAIVGEMVAALLSNYLALGDRPALPVELNPMLLNARGKVAPARSLFLSGSYPTGSHVERLFARVYGAEQFLARPMAFGPAVSAADLALLERFFAWLGVNRFVRFEQLRWNSQSCPYVSYVLQAVGRPDAFRDAALDCRALPEQDLARMLAVMTREELVEWLLRDDAARALLASDNSDKFAYAKVAERNGTAIHELVRKPSYLSYQLRRARPFDRYVLEVEPGIADLVNPFAFDFCAAGLRQAGATRRDIEGVLLQLGASERIDQLPLSEVVSMLRRLPQRDPDGKAAQRLYRLAMRHYDVHGQPLPPDVPLFASAGAHATFRQPHEIYYSDNVRLPARIVRTIAMLDYPRRSGGLKVPAFFGVKSLNAIVVRVEHHEPLPALTAGLAAALRDKLPFLLAYRLREVTSDRQGEAQKLAGLAIVPCADVTCTVDGASFPLALNDHVRDGSTHFVRVERTVSLTELMNDRHFCDAFADIVSSLFAVGEYWGEFRGVFRNDLAEIEHLARRELGDAAIREARQLLRVSDPVTAFWSALGAVKYGSAAEDVSPAAIAALRAELDGHAVDLDSVDADLAAATSYTDRIGAVLAGLGISVQEFNRCAFYKLDLADTHHAHLLNCQHRRFGRYRDALWHRLSGADWTARRKYLDLLAAAERTDWADEVAAAHSEQLDLDYDTVVARRLPIDGPDAPLADSEVWYGEHRRQLGAEQLATLPAELRSLLYFAGGLEHVTAHLTRQQAQTQEGATTAPEDSAMAVPVPEEAARPVAAPALRGGRPRAGGSPLYNPTQDMQRRQSGASAEQVVLASLIARYGAEYVVHVAQRLDGDGYDIRYSPDQSASWRYVEVKRYTSGRIYLSANEFAFATSHRGNYEIFLVNADDQIDVLRDIDFNDGTCFRVAASEYEVLFTLEAHVDDYDGQAI